MYRMDTEKDEEVWMKGTVSEQRKERDVLMDIEE